MKALTYPVLVTYYEDRTEDPYSHDVPYWKPCLARNEAELVEAIACTSEEHAPQAPYVWVFTAEDIACAPIPWQPSDFLWKNRLPASICEKVEARKQEIYKEELQRREAWERAQYERLKAKYSGGEG